MPFWFFFTGFAQDPQRNLIGSGFSAISPLIRIKSITPCSVIFGMEKQTIYLIIRNSSNTVHITISGADPGGGGPGAPP
jgi:hypothetical protein